MREIFKNLLTLLDRGEDAVLATVASARGSTPRGAGAQLLAGREGLVAGTIGGGPGEAQTLAFAAELLHERRSALRRLELRHGGELDSVCGGEQEVLFQFVPHDSAVWRALAREALARLEARRSGWLALEAGGDPLGGGPGGCAWDGKRLTLPLPVGERVVIFGGGHCALALVPVLRSVGFRVAVFDDRRSFADPARFPEAETVVCHAYTDIAGGLALTPEDYGYFLTELFQLWAADDGKGSPPYIRQFDNYIGLAAGIPAEACDQRGTCGIQYVVEADGGVYPCDFYMLDEYRLGNFNQDRLDQIDSARERIGFVERSRKLDPACRSCRFYLLCQGGCQRHRDFDPVEGVYKNFFCQSYRIFFENCFDKIMELGKRL